MGYRLFPRTLTASPVVRSIAAMPTSADFDVTSIDSSFCRLVTSEFGAAEAGCATNASSRNRNPKRRIALTHPEQLRLPLHPQKTTFSPNCKNFLLQGGKDGRSHRPHR